MTALSVVTPGTHVPPRSLWEGVPGQVTGRAPEVPTINRNEHEWSPVGFAFVYMVHGAVLGVLTSPYYVMVALGNSSTLPTLIVRGGGGQFPKFR